jgi:maltose alpha-D-glucosyltransferase / alpha-amylase
MGGRVVTAPAHAVAPQFPRVVVLPLRMAPPSKHTASATKKPGSANDPLWFKDAIIYELPVKAFYDGNNDGVGDFAGLLQKLDYLQDLGVTCLWLLPFFPSPLRDDGYDISDYRNIHPQYGTMEEFQTFLAAAHGRGMQVMIELVVNHTSDQHPWFQAARNAPAGSNQRNYYVWSDTDQKYRDARIIFTDTEKSNWTWDPVAKAYFWHRFFSHQPDLNFDNPEVVSEIVATMRFWLDMGVDALRLDAIPYLVERDGTSCENLSETHAIVKILRQHMDDGYSHRMILAEANQWPADVLPYFGAGDECHMAFHFPLMPRLFMALRLEDRHPVIEIMGQTPDIPESCQWGLFLRNHDELTLEMVSKEERDYMYLAYSSDPQMRINVGIRRRLAPLLDNNRRRLELMNSILLSFPGTPILYYGDEIGMGDNVYLGDRNGVRTPMQWTSDRNAGFSRVSPARLYGPVVMDPVYGYESINVEAQQSESSSLLNWTRNLIALRKLFRVFGRGTIEFLRPANRKVLAYVRTFDGEKVLCVANLSRFAQPTELDLSRFEGLVPVEMLGYVEFPKIRKTPYSLTLAPYGYFWFELQASSPSEVNPEEHAPENASIVFTNWPDLLRESGRQPLERALAGFLVRQRWFGNKARPIDQVIIRDAAIVPAMAAALIIVDVRYLDGDSDSYFVPLIHMPPEVAQAHLEKFPQAGVAKCWGGDGEICDATLDQNFCRWMLDVAGHAQQVDCAAGTLKGVPGISFATLRGDESQLLPAERSSGDQSNTSVRFGEKFIMKVFRRLEAGPNPDCEITQYLSEERGNTHVPSFAGAIHYSPREGEDVTLGMVQNLVDNQGDGWSWTLEELGRYYESCATRPFPQDWRGLLSLPVLSVRDDGPSGEAIDTVGLYFKAASSLARRTAEMHLDLGGDTANPAFQSGRLNKGDLGELLAGLRAHARDVFDGLKMGMARIPDDVVEHAAMVLGRRREIAERFRGLESLDLSLKVSRVHGDYHLGQVLRVMDDFVILDFEGEPARPLVERRSLQSPLKDVAGMLRSFSYAAQVGYLNFVARHPRDATPLEPWAKLWENCVSAAFISAYREAVAGTDLIPTGDLDLGLLLDAFLLDKALYELKYELNSRPSWVRIPLLGILALSR